MSREALHLLVEKYLQNRCSEEEKLVIEKLYRMLDKEGLETIYPEELDVMEQELWDKINQQTTAIPQEQRPDQKHYEEQPAQKPTVKRWRPNRIVWFAAAVISAFALITGYLFLTEHQNPQYLNFKSSNCIRIEKNNTDKPLHIKLEDGSLIILEPKSSLSYPQHFNKAIREVSLEGDAYFLISKNPKRPFFVYNNKLITRVVGTSFIIKTDTATRQTEVTVKTGKVVVTLNENKELNLKHLFEEDKKAVLTPNQKTSYSTDQDQFKTSLVADPVPLPGHENLTKATWVFEDAPITDVLNKLQDTYGIEILTQNQELYSNTFTGDISKQSLYKKLDILCHAIKAYYELSGTKIVIKTKL